MEVLMITSLTKNQLKTFLLLANIIHSADEYDETDLFTVLSAFESQDYESSILKALEWGMIESENWSMKRMINPALVLKTLLLAIEEHISSGAAAKFLQTPIAQLYISEINAMSGIKKTD